MNNEYVLTNVEDEGLAIRTVVEEESPTANSLDVLTTTTDGKLAIRTVVAAGGGDQHNLGYYATQSDLETAHPTAEAGDWAIVGSTDTVWIWDDDNSVWVDSDRKGQVTSVNNQTGDVTVQETLVSGTNIKTIDGNSILGSGDLELSTYLTYPNTWATTGTTKAFCDDIAADSSAVAGKAYLGEVTLSDLPASMANAEIVVEIMSGTTANNKIIVLTCTSGNTAPYRWQYTYWNNGTNVSGWKGFQEELTSGTNIKTINGSSVLGSGDLTISGLPSQTGNAGKFLQTDGTDASWQNAAQVSQPSTMPTLAVADWVLDSGTNKYTQTVNVAGVTANNVVYVAPFPANADEYAQCNVIAVSQGAGTIGFQADVLPTNALGVNVVVLS